MGVGGGLALVLRCARGVVGQNLSRVAAPATAPRLHLLHRLLVLRRLHRRHVLLVLRVVGGLACVLCRARRMFLYDAVPVVSLRISTTPRLRIELGVGGGLTLVLSGAGRVVGHDLPLRRRLLRRRLHLSSVGTVVLCPVLPFLAPGMELLVGGSSLICGSRNASRNIEGVGVRSLAFLPSRSRCPPVLTLWREPAKAVRTLRRAHVRRRPRLRRSLALQEQGGGLPADDTRTRESILKSEEMRI